MEAYILDTNFEVVAILDTFNSFLWTDRYDKCGDFEIYLEASEIAVKLLKEDYYIWTKESEHLMIIEDSEITTDDEAGSYLTITGRSLESILDRRIVWNETVIKGSLQNGIKKLLDENIISPSDSNRKISNFIFEASTDPYISGLTLDNQYRGESLYEIICSICEANSIGFKITLNNDNKFVFKLYNGVDRSYDQLSNPYVIFSPDFDNIINSRFLQSKKMLKTLALVIGEETVDEEGNVTGYKSTTAQISSGGGTGLSRREIFVDAGDIYSDSGEEPLTDDEYKAQLSERGKEILSENSYIKAFEGQVETSKLFIYGRDFFMGDIVQLKNEYGIESKSRVIEVLISQSTEGFNIFPTFSALE